MVPIELHNLIKQTVQYSFALKPQPNVSAHNMVFRQEWQYGVMEEYNHRPSSLAYFTALAEIVSVDLGGLHRVL